MNNTPNEKQYNFGPQAFDRILTEHHLANKDIVKASTEPITFKMVQKGRKGRRLTRKVQIKLLNALNHLLTEEEPPYKLRDLFNY